MVCVGAYMMRDYTPVEEQIVTKGQQAQAHGIRVCSDSLRKVMPKKHYTVMSAMPFSALASHITFQDSTTWTWTCLTDMNGKIMTFRR